MTCDDGRTEESPDCTWTGTATQIYLGLWNRGNEIQQDGVDVLTFWRDHLRIEWH